MCIRGIYEELYKARNFKIILSVAKEYDEKLNDSFIQVLPNMYHGEFSINHADDYVRKLLKIVKQR